MSNDPPVTASVPLVGRAVDDAITSVPLFNVIVPTLLVPLKVTVPVPSLINSPEPEIFPAKLPLAVWSI